MNAGLGAPAWQGPPAQDPTSCASAACRSYRWLASHHQHCRCLVVLQFVAGCCLPFQQTSLAAPATGFVSPPSCCRCCPDIEERRSPRLLVTGRWTHPAFCWCARVRSQAITTAYSLVDVEALNGIMNAGVTPSVLPAKTSCVAQNANGGKVGTCLRERCHTR